ncbi:Oxidoreductase [Coemansia sp. RSA 2523]|nr:Oxidoreductase [Coemansia sp. RSA 1824]KAJ1763131.1 Oxidoreductase [Coemansia sp. RSA 1591]KAJ1768353.1 Oxidoreductase [Coemansia sp. RSA 1752]KAJ1795293.1 Oxidoreductase [Coemansia sp. RSA 1938]KAJ1796931.1 Oxidoreductase [Coemansia sp. RSA 2523]KAJ2135365.1 Oxidoreductase [Coemansia sp. RSA 788]KAJ2155276.1 Oxidoreductase [Coemansia sp. RSA 637]KAJ2156001.1 Oxidoreductase [Coemansia sp. RSA 562]KAJ2222287.1 Oxidoreductase [Coemansia sp. RSA 520]KAJ2283985.1 Oxidoreductase [Coemansia s
MTANDTQPSSFDTDLTASLEQETKERFDHETDETREESDERDTSIDTADLAAEQEQSSQSQAFNPETGEINWDCPCLGGMAHGTCGEQFKSAFSCFVYSEEEPKGMDCVSVFKDMQECFRAHPEEYASELEDNEEDEEEEEESEELSGDVVGFVEDKSDNESDNESNNESNNESDNESDNETDIEDLSDADHKPRDGASQN